MLVITLILTDQWMDVDRFSMSRFLMDNDIDTDHISSTNRFRVS